MRVTTFNMDTTHMIAPHKAGVRMSDGVRTRDARCDGKDGTQKNIFKKEGSKSDKNRDANLNPIRGVEHIEFGLLIRAKRSV